MEKKYEWKKKKLMKSKRKEEGKNCPAGNWKPLNIHSRCLTSVKFFSKEIERSERKKKYADLKYNLPARFKDIPSKAISMLSLSLYLSQITIYHRIMI